MVLELKESLKKAEKDAAVQNAKNEAARQIESLNKENEDALMQASDEGYAEAVSAAANEVEAMRDRIYQAGYDFGL